MYVIGLLYVNKAHVHNYCLQRPKDSSIFPETGVQMVVSHYVGAGKHNLGPMQEQQVFLSTEPALQTLHFKIK